jgi:hypothetical protein
MNFCHKVIFFIKISWFVSSKKIRKSQTVCSLTASLAWGSILKLQFTQKPRQVYYKTLTSSIMIYLSLTVDWRYPKSLKAGILSLRRNVVILKTSEQHELRKRLPCYNCCIYNRVVSFIQSYFCSHCDLVSLTVLSEWRVQYNCKYMLFEQLEFKYNLFMNS